MPGPPRVQVGEAAGVTSDLALCQMGSESPGIPSGALPQKLVISNGLDFMGGKRFLLLGPVEGGKG